MPRPPRDPDQYTMSFGEHLEELRRRLIYALLGSGIVVAGTLYYGRDIVAWLYEPLYVVLKAADLPGQTYPRSTLVGFTVYAKVSIAAALVISAPWIIYQMWKFIEAGLYATERKMAVVLMLLSSAMTALGLAFLYYVFLPAVLVFLIFFTTTYPVPPSNNQSFLARISRYFVHLNENTLLPGAHTGEGDTTAPATTSAAAVTVPVLEEDPAQPAEGQIWFNRSRNEMRLFQGGRLRVVTLTSPSMMVPLIDPNDYLTEVAWLALVVVIIFHVPVVMAVLGMTGLVEPQTLSKRRKAIVFGCFVAAVILTPSQDVFSNVAIPLLMWALFEVGLVCMRFFYRRHQASLADDSTDVN